MHAERKTPIFAEISQPLGALLARLHLFCHDLIFIQRSAKMTSWSSADYSQRMAQTPVTRIPPLKGSRVAEFCHLLVVHPIERKRLPPPGGASHLQAFNNTAHP
jgi:hypothetical protein